VGVVAETTVVEAAQAVIALAQELRVEAHLLSLN